MVKWIKTMNKDKQMQPNFTFDNTWSPKLLRLLHEEAPQITNAWLQGSASCNMLGAAVDMYNQTEMTALQVKSFCQQAHKHSHKIAWTIDETCIGNTAEFLKTWDACKELLLEFLTFIEIDQLVVAHPLLLLKLQELNSSIPIKLSAFAGITEPNQLLMLLDLGCKITTISVPIEQNRNQRWLHALIALCDTLSVTVEVTVNDFTYLTGCNCSGLLGLTQANMWAHAKQDDPAVANELIDLLTTIRNTDPINAIRAKWILPQQLKQYGEMGIHQFRILSSTEKTLIRILRAYLNNDYTGLLSDLCAETEVPEIFDIPIEHLVDFSYSILVNCNNDCSTCMFCENAYYNICIEGTEECDTE